MCFKYLWQTRFGGFFSGLAKFLKENIIEMFPTENIGKSAFDERFIMALKNKIYKYKISILKMYTSAN